jgi:hypothetical protein
MQRFYSSVFASLLFMVYAIKVFLTDHICEDLDFHSGFTDRLWPFFEMLDYVNGRGAFILPYARQDARAVGATSFFLWIAIIGPLKFGDWGLIVTLLAFSGCGPVGDERKLPSITAMVA